MAATGYHNGASTAPEPTDLASLWNDALQKYREESETELPQMSMSMILDEQDRQLQLFGQVRHNKGKVDKLRSVVLRSSELIQSLVSNIANAASTAFPPSYAILAAFNLIMNASKAVSEDYDMIVSFFDIMKSFLERISMLEKKLPLERQYQNALVNVFAALLTLCAIARKYRQKGRMLKWAKALVDGQDPKLKEALDTLHTQMGRLESATVIATLKISIESGQKLDGVGRDIKNIQSSVNMSLELGQQNLSYAKDTAVAGTEILTILHRQEGTGVEQIGRLRNIERALQKNSRDKDAVDQQMDAGARKSAALRQVRRLLSYNLDDREQLADLESTFVEGTCDWFRGSDEYNEFEAGNIPLLWITGASGVGKSTLSSRLVSILRQEPRGEGVTSVAHFFFREDLETFRSVATMLRSCAVQIAVNDVNYRESILADLQRVRGGVKIDDLEELWRHLFQRRFTKEAKRRLFLVLDGVDEADESAAEQIAKIFSEISTSRDLQISVLFTSNPGFIDGSGRADIFKVRRFEMDKEKIKPDLKRIVLARLATLGRLRKLTKKTKRKIKDRLIKQADTIRYLEHMLRRLNSMGRDKTVLRELENLPPNTEALYELLLEDAQKGRSEGDKEVLRKLFAWLAYSMKPLRLASASHLLHFIAKDNNISIDEELEYRCARILRLSNVAQDGGQATEWDIDSENEDKKDDDEKGNFTEDLNVLLGFQERGMRSYFRETDIEEGGLRSCPSVGNMMIFEVIGNMLTAEKKSDSASQDMLYDYAANKWLSHLLEIKPEALTQAQKAGVIEALCSILTNRNEALKMLEEYSENLWNNPSVFTDSDDSHEKAVQALKEWSRISKELPPSLLSPSTLSWIRPFTQNPKMIYIKLADAHVTNWLASVNVAWDGLCNASFCFAHRALELGKDLPSMKQNDELRAYFEERASHGSMHFTERSFIVVSKVFLHIEKTAQSYKNIGMAMKFDDLLEQSLHQFELGLSVSDNDRDSIQLYSEMADVLICLAKTAESHSQEPESEEKHEPGDIAGLEEQELGDGSTKANNFGANGTNIDSSTEEEKKRKTTEQWAQEACDILAKAAAINPPVSTEDEDEDLLKAVVNTWVNRTIAELLLGNTEHTVEYIAKAYEANSKGDYISCIAMFEELAENQEWAKMLNLIRLSYPNLSCIDVFEGLAEKQEWAKILDLLRLPYPNMWMHLCNEGPVHRAAKETGQTDCIVEMYTKAISLASARPRESLYFQWASLYQTVLGGDRMGEAKPLLYKVIETSNDTLLISEASFNLANIFLEEFRTTRDPARKEAAFVQMQALVRRIKESMGTEFDPTQSQTMIPLALMTRRLNTLDFQRGLDQTFRGCVEALTDEDSWNDSVSFRTLAKVLACVPGLKMEAEVAATCQLYIVDMDKYEKEITPGSELGSMELEENVMAGDGSEVQDNKDTASIPGTPNSSTAVVGTTDAGLEEKSTGETEPTANGTLAKLPDGNTKSDNLIGNVKSPDEEEQSIGEEPGREEDLDITNCFLACNNCRKSVRSWHDGAMYLCYYCTELNLCEKCYNEKLDRESGKLPPDWRVLCPAGHQHVRAPVAGWKGLKGGVLKFEDKEVSFQQWLIELKEKKWVEAWDQFWADELC